MNLHELKYTEGARKDKHRVGRGHAAGKGKQAGRGQSGQNKRNGVRLGFEGGQNPWYRRVPKRGFSNINHIEYQVISLSTLDKIYPDNSEITIESLNEKKIARKSTMPVKLLANGFTNKKFTIYVNAASEKAINLVEKMGGKVEVI